LGGLAVVDCESGCLGLVSSVQRATVVEGVELCARAWSDASITGGRPVRGLWVTQVARRTGFMLVVDRTDPGEITMTKHAQAVASAAGDSG
jgi:hypothetical protein